MVQSQRVAIFVCSSCGILRQVIKPEIAGIATYCVDKRYMFLAKLFYPEKVESWIGIVPYRFRADGIFTDSTDIEDNIEPFLFELYLSPRLHPLRPDIFRNL